MGAGASRELGVQLGEVVGLGHQVGLHLDAGQRRELGQQRLEALLVRVRRLQDLDAGALGLLPVEAAADLVGAVLGGRAAAAPDATGVEQRHRGRR
jgi:hypothetical protein